MDIGTDSDHISNDYNWSYTRKYNDISGKYQALMSSQNTNLQIKDQILDKYMFGLNDQVLVLNEIEEGSGSFEG
ncbi:MAG: hypothetical protein GY751_11105 [Bacteroidetes bacterium]|nr:hypothetical protein [Bacteroidota bacterium]